jgi:predicted AlkP superfamily pyrophosphatase or phosphodiesterase
MLRSAFGVLALLCLTALSSCSGNAASQASVPDHVVVMVFDQMRPDYIDRFNLENFKRLRSSSRNYPEAYVGSPRIADGCKSPRHFYRTGA